MKFLEGLDNDIKKVLIAQIRNLWTHSSTAIEGNSLTLGETAFVLEEGLTVSGKPLRDHQEVVGHSRAIDLIYDIVKREKPVEFQDIFNIHKAVQTEVIVDIFKPVGAWKKETNGTYRVEGDKQVFFEYAAPIDVPILMEAWLTLLNQNISKTLSKDEALAAYAELHISFARIHPFFDGNGRMARLLSNIPVLKAGLPPIIIPKERRKDYLSALAEYDKYAGTPKREELLLPKKGGLENFKRFCADSWKATICLVEEAKKNQSKRCNILIEKQK